MTKYYPEYNRCQSCFHNLVKKPNIYCQRCLQKQTNLVGGHIPNK